MQDYLRERTEIVVYPTLQKQNYQLFKNLKWHFSTLISSYIFLAIDWLNITAYFSWICHLENIKIQWETYSFWTYSRNR
jgi:hypothetical protein